MAARPHPASAARADPAAAGFTHPRQPGTASAAAPTLASRAGPLCRCWAHRPRACPGRACRMICHPLRVRHGAQSPRSGGTVVLGVRTPGAMRNSDCRSCLRIIWPIKAWVRLGQAHQERLGCLNGSSAYPTFHTTASSCLPQWAARSPLALLAGGGPQPNDRHLNTSRKIEPSSGPGLAMSGAALLMRCGSQETGLLRGALMGVDGRRPEEGSLVV